MALILKGRAKLKGSTVIGKRPYAIDGVFNPELVLDFQKNYYRTNSVAKTFPNAITHTRASTATYVDADGILQTAATNVPRVGHHVWNGTAWVNEGLLHESEARTNFALRSEELNISPWGYSNVTVTANATTAPYGGSTADNVVESSDAVASFHSITQQITGLANNTVYTISLFLKQSGRSRARVSLLNKNGDNPGAIFDLAAGVVVSELVGVISSNIEDAGNGWYRCVITANSASGATTPQLRLWPADTSNNIQYIGDGVSGLFVWGAQLEAAPTPSSYIPTSGSTVTRAADVLTIPAANLPYNSTALSIQMDGRVTYADEGIFSTAVGVRWQKDAQNRIVTFDLSTNSTDTGVVFFSQEAADVYDFVGTGNVLSPDILVPFNIASRHGSTFINGAVDGVALTANTTPVALPDLSASNLQLGFDYNGTIRTFRMWGQDIGDTGLVEATEPSLVPSLSLTFDGTENSFIVNDWSE
jgi:hypothetical protein